MLELVQEYGGDLLDFMKKYGKQQKKRFWSADLLRKFMDGIGHPAHRGQIFFSKYGVYGYQKTQNFT
jgi:hypothetical protein